MRTEALLKPGSAPSVLKPCPDCKLVFFCGAEHWEQVKAIHTQLPCPDGLYGMTQCAIAKTIREETDGVDGRDLWPLNRANWAPLRVKDKWTSLVNRTWESEFAVELRKEPTLQMQLEMKEAELQKLRSETVERMRMEMETGEKQVWDEVHAGGDRDEVEYGDRISVRVREASIGLSMPMSILWALENMNEGDEWTRRDTLTVHVRSWGSVLFVLELLTC